MALYHSDWLDEAPDLLQLSGAFPAEFPYLLESASRGEQGLISLLLFAGDEVLVSDPVDGLSGPGNGSCFFERLEHWYQRERSCRPDAEPQSAPALPFLGGWFLFLGYEMAGEIEPRLDLPKQTTGMPDAMAHRCPGAIIVFHPADDSAVERAIAVAESAAVLESIIHCLGGFRSRPAAPVAAGFLLELSEEDPTRFTSGVHRIHEYLRAGDVFQVNISRSWSGSFDSKTNPLALYQALRFCNPAPFAGMVRWNDLVLMSSSPERLVQTRGRLVQTRPIAGTRPRGDDDRHDRALSEALIGNLKEQAEHVMLIDLERNDLGRVCKPGSIEVNELMVVESYAHVHHIVSNVRGELRDGVSPVDALKAVFPGGTITGCPKIRCMEIIAELEREGRGYYTGSMGYLDRFGRMDLNILIRSILIDGRRFTFRTGAGIVADSDPAHELAETADKARGMLLAVETHGGERRRA
ncbi:MAG: aminodeoxychorismate synthase component I [Xanthomonadales bacterium]|nr:aminodeoxychorismate synthase component I [Xanthomonadales bacterium]